MIRGKKKPKEVLSRTEVQNIEEEKRDLELSLREAEGYGQGTAGEQMDKAKIRANIRRLDTAIADSDPGRVTSKAKDSLVREERELEARFVQGMPTRYEMDHPAKCPGAVRKHLHWLEMNEKPGYVARYRTIQRLIRPGEEKSVEALRKDR